jgi:hypothetical protein
VSCHFPSSRGQVPWSAGADRRRARGVLGPALVLHKPWFRMRVTVSRPDGAPVGSIRKRIRVGKARFVLEDPSGADIGDVWAQNWRARDFAVTDVNRQPVAQVTKKWRGLIREAFTDADTYVVEVLPHASEPGAKPGYCRPGRRLGDEAEGLRLSRSDAQAGLRPPAVRRCRRTAGALQSPRDVLENLF